MSNPDQAAAPPDAATLDAIEARLKAATPGPWRAKQMNKPEDDPWFFVLDANGRGPVMETVVAQTKYLVTPEAQQRADMEFVAHAPEDIAALLSALTVARARLSALERDAAVLSQYVIAATAPYGAGPVHEAAVRVRALLVPPPDLAGPGGRTP